MRVLVWNSRGGDVRLSPAARGGTGERRNEVPIVARRGFHGCGPALHHVAGPWRLPAVAIGRPRLTGIDIPNRRPDLRRSGQGRMDALTGRWIKDAVRGRSIDVRRQYQGQSAVVL